MKGKKYWHTGVSFAARDAQERDRIRSKMRLIKALMVAKLKGQKVSMSDAIETALDKTIEELSK